MKKHLWLATILTALVCACGDGESGPTAPIAPAPVVTYSMSFEMEDSTCESQFASMLVVMQCLSGCVGNDPAPRTLPSSAYSKTTFAGLAAGSTWKYSSVTGTTNSFTGGTVTMHRDMELSFGNCV